MTIMTAIVMFQYPCGCELQQLLMLRFTLILLSFNTLAGVSCNQVNDHEGRLQVTFQYPCGCELQPR